MDHRDNTLPPRAKRRISRQTLNRSVDALNLVLTSRADTAALGRAIGRVLTGGEILALIGTLGVGKTALVKGIAAGLGIPSHCVSSPTFVLAHEYQGRVPMTHMDLYRIKDSREAHASGIFDCVQGETVVAIEWADRFPACLPADRLEIRLAHRAPHSRAVAITALGPEASRLLDRITQRRRSLTSRRRKRLQQGKASAR